MTDVIESQLKTMFEDGCTEVIIRRPQKDVWAVVATFPEGVVARPASPPNTFSQLLDLVTRQAQRNREWERQQKELD